MKQNFKISINNLDGTYSTAIVKGEFISLVEGIDTFVHRYNVGSWGVSELLTGRRIIYHNGTRKKALKEAKKILLKRKEEALKIIENLIKKEGALNIKKEV